MYIDCALSNFCSVFQLLTEVEISTAWGNLSELEVPADKFEACLRIDFKNHVQSRIKFFNKLIEEKRDFHRDLLKLGPFWPTTDVFRIAKVNGEQVMALSGICDAYRGWLHGYKKCGRLSRWWAKGLAWLRTRGSRAVQMDDCTLQGLREALSTYSLYGSTVPLLGPP